VTSVIANYCTNSSAGLDFGSFWLISVVFGGFWYFSPVLPTQLLCIGARERKTVHQIVSGSDTSTKKLKQQQITGIIHNANMVTQEAVDSAVTNLVAGALLPIRIVEVAKFKAEHCTYHK